MIKLVCRSMEKVAGVLLLWSGKLRIASGTDEGWHEALHIRAALKAGATDMCGSGCRLRVPYGQDPVRHLHPRRLCRTPDPDDSDPNEETP